MMGRARCLLLVVCAVIATSAPAAAAVQNPAVVVFYSEGCEDCERMLPILNALQAEYPSVGFLFIESSDPDAALMWQLAAAYNIVPSQFPVVFIGETAVVGASRASEATIRSAIRACSTSACPSPLDSVRPVSVLWLAILLAGLAAVVLAIVLWA